MPPTQRITALDALAVTYGGKLEVLDSSGKSVDAGTWLTGERDRVQSNKAADAKLSSEVDRVPDSRNAGLQVAKYRRGL